MNLANFERDINKIILKRGKEYFEHGHVEAIDKLEEGIYEIEVIGSEDYTVNIHLDNNTILDSSCDCPYDVGEYCKHEVAAFYALRSSNELMKGTSEKTPKKDIKKTNKKEELKTILLKLEKEKLIEIIMDVSQDYPQVKKKLIFKHTFSQDEILASKNLINDYINSFKKYGYIDWKDLNNALYGAELTLQKAIEKFNANDIEKAVLLSLTVLASVIDMLDYCDDSNGVVSEIIYECLELVHRSVSSGIMITNEHIKEKVFTSIIDEALHKRYKDFVDWQIELLKTAVLLCDSKDRKVMLEKLLGDLLKESSHSSWSSKYMVEQVKMLQLELILKSDGEHEAFKFIQSNIAISSFRKLAIDHFLSIKNYNEVLRLCAEGIKIDKEYRGLVNDWKKYQLQAYEGIGDTAKQKEQMLEFLYENGYEYYAKLKELYQPEEWEVKLQEILETFENNSYIPSTYIEILKVENFTNKILEYCQKNLSYISDLYPYIVESFEEEANIIYIQYIKEKAARASNRSNYRQVCTLIRQYKKVAGVKKTQSLIEQLKQKYVRRPAFIDELKNIKS